MIMNDKFVSAPTLIQNTFRFTIVNHFCNLLGCLNKLNHTLIISAVIKNDKSVNVAQLKDILNFPYDFRKLFLMLLM